VASYSPCSLPSAPSAGEYLLNVLVIAKPTYKGLIVPGGKVDMMFTAKGFGKEDGECEHDVASAAGRRYPPGSFCDGRIGGG
jgi:hypothetical protein